MLFPTQNRFLGPVCRFPYSVLEGRTPANNGPIEIHVKKT